MTSKSEPGLADMNWTKFTHSFDVIHVTAGDSVENLCVENDNVSNLRPI